MQSRGALSTDRFVACATLTVAAAASLLPPGTPMGVRLVPTLGVAALVAVAWRRPSSAGGIALLFTVLLLTSGLSPLLWQVNMAAAIGALALASRYRPELGAPKLRRGELLLGGTLLCGLVTPIALVGWVALLKPDVSNIVQAIPDYPVAVLMAGAIVFAVVNAALEEWIWRGVIQTRLTELFSPTVAIVVQAVSFGIAHAWGFPRGIAGVLLVGVWGVMLGVLRHHAQGLLAVVLAHIVADATIAAIVLFWLR